MKHYLLLGAGFSRNWGGWLASEAFEYLLGDSAVARSAPLRELLWKNQPEGVNTPRVAIRIDAEIERQNLNFMPKVACGSPSERRFFIMSDGGVSISTTTPAVEAGYRIESE